VLYLAAPSAICTFIVSATSLFWLNLQVLPIQYRYPPSQFWILPFATSILCGCPKLLLVFRYFKVSLYSPWILILHWPAFLLITILSYSLSLFHWLLSSAAGTSHLLLFLMFYSLAAQFIWFFDSMHSYLTFAALLAVTSLPWLLTLPVSLTPHLPHVCCSTFCNFSSISAYFACFLDSIAALHFLLYLL
jgi:hypothetical protein